MSVSNWGIGRKDYTSGDTFTTGEHTEQHKVSVTSTVTPQTWTNSIKAFLIYNDGPNEVYFSFGSDPTTNNFKIPSGSSLTIDISSKDTRFICASGETATLYVIGMY